MAAEQLPIDLSAFAPFVCGNQHVMKAGKTLVGWRPCTCAGTKEAGTRGHNTDRCLECHVNGVDMVYLNPPHEAGDGHTTSESHEGA